MSDTQIFQPKAKKDKSFGKYKVVRELGRGAMGVVYECFDPDFERTVAVKILSPDLMKHDTSGEYRQRFKNEMKAAGRLTHPNVISVFDAGEQEGVPYFVMEYVNGMELKQALDDGQCFEQFDTVRIMKEVLSGLKYIHAHNIIHRDLKPANIFLTDDGAAKITDFGIAKLESSELTRVGTILGSPRYMSPEQCQGLPVDARSDLFTAGIIFYQLLTNEHCFDSSSPTAIMQKIIHSDPNAPSLLIPTLNRSFDQVLLKALQKRAEDRFQTADEFINALDLAVEGKFGKPEKADKGRSSLALAGMLVTAISVGAAGVFFVPKALDSWNDEDVQRPVSGIENDKQMVTASDGDSIVADEANQVVNQANGSENNLNQKQESTAPDTKVPDQPVVADSGSNDDAAVNDPPPISAKNQAKLRRVLIVAEMHALQGRLVAPSGSNAFDAYKIALEIDPKNQKAAEGIDRLEDSLIEKINQLVKEGKTSQAATEAKNGAQIFPDNQVLARLSRDL